jgi:hypothetical protein
MATYVPNATQATEPTESRSVESAALEFRTLKESVTARVDALQSNIDDLEAQVEAGDASDLRVPEAAVAPLPVVSARAGKVLGFDGAGNPTMVAVSGTSDPSLRADLAQQTGATLVGADDAASGSLFTTVQGFITRLRSSVGAALVGFIQAGVGAVMRTLQDKARDAVSVKDFGAVGDGVADDTDAIQAAIDSGAACVHFPQGTYKVVTASSKSFDYGNTTVGTYVAIGIDRSNLTITGDNAVIELFAAPAASGSIVYAFATAKNMTLGAVSDISISGLRFEFNPAGKTAATYRSISIIGCRGVVLDNLFLYSSGSRYGATVTLQNCEQVRFSNMRWRNTTQGINFSYVDDVQFENLMFDYFSEAIDFDRMVSRCNANNVNFTSTFGSVSGQCWDLNSVRDSNFSSITANRCGNIFYTNFKQTTPPTYAEYVNNDPVTIFTPSRNITINGVKVNTCAQNGMAFFIGDDANTEPGVLTSKVTISNVDMTDSGGFEVRMATDVLLENIKCNNAHPITAANFALFFILKGSRTNAKTSAKLKNISVDGMASVQDVIRISEVESCLMDGLTIENYDLDAVEISQPPAGSHYSITNSKFLRTKDAVVTGAALRITSVLTEQVQFDWNNNVITQFTVPFVLGGAAAGTILPCKKLSYGQQSFTSGTKRMGVYADKNKTAYFGQLLAVDHGSAGNATNFVSYNIRNSGSSVGSGSDTAGTVMGVPYGIGFTTPEALAEVSPGQFMYVDATASGTGRTLDAFELHAYYVEYLKV